MRTSLTRKKLLELGKIIMARALWKSCINHIPIEDLETLQGDVSHCAKMVNSVMITEWLHLRYYPRSYNVHPTGQGFETITGHDDVKLTLHAFFNSHSQKPAYRGLGFKISAQLQWQHQISTLFSFVK